jgi:hypothetical protein
VHGRYSNLYRADTFSISHKGSAMGLLTYLGLAIIIVWLVLWLAVKVTFGAIHLLVVLGIVMLVVGFLKSSR